MIESFWNIMNVFLYTIDVRKFWEEAYLVNIYLLILVKYIEKKTYLLIIYDIF